MSISSAVAEALTSSSWIRKMFTQGQALKDKYGPENVFDLSLGNPNLEPPEAFKQAVMELAASDVPGLHGYMPNSGYPDTRQAIATYIGTQEEVDLTAADVVMTVGAAGALNVSLAAVLDDGDEVIILEPYFVEYKFYVQNHGGVVKIVSTTEDFDIDLDAIAATLTDRTKCIIINTPNNPTGCVYSQERINDLATLMADHERKHDSTLYLIVDTPYSKLTYDGVHNPKFFLEHPNTLIAHSFSKELGLAGERIGFLAISPSAIHREALQNAAAFTNRTLGFVNAPAMMQRAVGKVVSSGGVTVDVGYYNRLRDRLMQGLREAGYQLTTPQGAFYLFPKTPIKDDIAFTQALAEKNVLVVPGSGFGRRGHVRIAYCVTPEVIEGALPLFADALKEVS